MALTLLAACSPATSPDITLAAPVVRLDREVVARVGEPVRIEAEVLEGHTAVRWWLGDGTESTSEVVEHVWTAPGHYAGAVEVTGADGRTASDAFDITIVHPPLARPPRHSAALAASADGATLYAVLPDFDRLAVIDVAGGRVTTHLDGCRHPRRLATAVLPTGGTRLAVSCEQVEPAVVLYDHTAEGLTEVGRLDLAPASRSPFGIVLGDDLRAYVTARGRYDPGGVLLVLDPVGGLLEEHPLGEDLRGLAWVEGHLLISRHRSAESGGAWWTFDPLTGIATPSTLALDPGPDSDTSSRGVPTNLQTLAVSPDGRRLVFGGLRANLQRGLVRDGLPLTDETTVRADLRSVALISDPIGPLRAARLDDRDLVSALTWHPRGDWLYAAVSGAGVIEVLDAWTLQLAASLPEIGDAPSGLWVQPDGAALWVLTDLERTLLRVPLDGARTGQPDLRLDLRPDGIEVLPEDVLLGKRLFHHAADPRMSRDGYVSCASCHLDGEGDGLTWDFTDRGEGLRNTISLRGMADRVGGPIHWSGNFDEVQDFEHDIRGPQAGAGFLTEADWLGANTTLGAPKAGLSVELDALAAYVEQLEVLDLPSTRDVSEGRALFEDPTLGCADCHPGGHTDAGWLGAATPRLHDVGSLRTTSGQRLGAALTGLVTPSLRGVWATAPYLHDGSAATLRDVLTTANPDDRHGVTSQLDSGDLEALEAFLRSL